MLLNQLNEFQHALALALTEFVRKVLYATAEQLDQIEVELLRQLAECGKCRTRDLIFY